MSPDQYAKANATIARLVELYPRTFFLLGRYRSPLKVGIFDDLVAAGMEPDELELAFRLYCRSYGYRLAMRAGTGRLNIAGEVDGTVSAEHAVTAKELEKCRAKWRARKEAERQAERKAAEEAAHAPYTEAWETVDKLSTTHPLAFFIKGRERRPLGLDTLNDLAGTMGAENALRLYTQSLGYLRSMKEGAARINLAGEPTGSLVTADEAADAAAAVIACQARIERRRQERKAAAQPTIVEAAPAVQEVQPVTAPAKLQEATQPKRLSLGDLKKSAMARRQLETAI